MDIHAIEKTGNQNVVRQEVAHSILLSDLVESKVSPNFVEIYDIMLSRKKPKAELWGSADVRKPNQAIKDLSMENEGVSGLFQYIHMEYCDGGDLETFIALQSEKQLPIINALIPFLFQMVFSVYCGREKFHLRHCDIKVTQILTCCICSNLTPT
jgi:serine/threonine protein kinase